jgi:hypothetical protein
MKRSEFGYLLLVVGVLVGVFALFFDTAVDVNYSTYGNSLNLPDRVENLGLMNKKISLIIASGILDIMGTILIVAPVDNSSVLLRHARAQTKLLSFLVAQSEVDANSINDVIEELKDENPLFFSEVDEETEEEEVG